MAVGRVLEVVSRVYGRIQIVENGRRKREGGKGCRIQV